MEVEQSQIVNEDVAYPLEQGQQVQQIQGEGLSSLPPSAPIKVSKRKPYRKPSKVWTYFKRVNDEAILCPKNPSRVVDKKQKTIAIEKKCEDDPNSVSLKLNVEIRWNSTYLMLNIAEEYEHAFYRLEHADVAFLTNLGIESKGYPNRADW
ncbi:hypothetical protein KIW84_031846 [Lathyrus oleraceus]|uniref:Uncharacterized protein n=1 Tax=Pisum sativum TaxID=3888 RepID=A0A9D4XU53_PEA|nr:hypothetical protein KIW84_031846 [Pisum sativum]